MTEEHKKKVKDSNIKYWKIHKRNAWNKGKKIPELSVKMKGNKNGKGNKGRKLSDTTKEKIRLSLLGRKNPEHSKRMKGRPSWNKGICGEKSHCWKGGISFLPYSVDWTETLKKSIRERDHYNCQNCGCYGNVVHHIDYDKKNCNPDNLITLCPNCHSKTGHNRNYWTQLFINKNK